MLSVGDWNVLTKQEAVGGDRRDVFVTILVDGRPVTGIVEHQVYDSGQWLSPKQTPIGEYGLLLGGEKVNVKVFTEAAGEDAQSWTFKPGVGERIFGQFNYVTKQEQEINVTREEVIAGYKFKLILDSFQRVLDVIPIDKIPPFSVFNVNALIGLAKEDVVKRIEDMFRQVEGELGVAPPGEDISLLSVSGATDPIKDADKEGLWSQLSQFFIGEQKKDIATAQKEAAEAEHKPWLEQFSGALQSGALLVVVLIGAFVVFKFMD